VSNLPLMEQAMSRMVDDFNPNMPEPEPDYADWVSQDAMAREYHEQWLAASRTSRVRNFAPACQAFAPNG
jgi:hypothetical protein